MSEQWYWKHRGDLLGPMPTEDLERLIQQRRVGDRDEIRLTTSADWLTGKDVKLMFSGRNDEKTSADAAAALLSESLRPKKLSSANPKPAHSYAEDLVSSAGSWMQIFTGGLFDSLRGLFQTVGAYLWPFICLFRFLLHPVSIMLMVGIAFNCVVVMQMNSDGDSLNRNVLKELDSAWGQLSAIPAEQLALTASKDLRQSVSQKLDKALADLNECAKRESLSWSGSLAMVPSSDRQRSIIAARKSLIQATRILKNEVKEQGQGERVPSTAAEFGKHIDLARRVLDNQYDYFKPHWGHQKAVTLRADSVTSTNPWLVFMIVADLVLIIVAVWYGLRAKARFS